MMLGCDGSIIVKYKQSLQQQQLTGTPEVLD